MKIISENVNEPIFFAEHWKYPTVRVWCNCCSDIGTKRIYENGLEFIYLFLSTLLFIIEMVKNKELSLGTYLHAGRACFVNIKQPSAGSGARKLDTEVAYNIYIVRTTFDKTRRPALFAAAVNRMDI